MKKMKRFLALALTMSMVLALAACGGKKEEDPTADAPAAEEPAADATSITLWTYPVGKWGDQATVEGLTKGFTEATGIKVNVEFLAYADGDDKVNTAITSKSTPDLILEGPERLVANWGANGYMVDLSDMLDDTDKAEISEAALTACTTADGKVYEYPTMMTAHCMAINLDAFKEAGADQYIDLETRTWTTENFFKAVDALYAKYGETVGAVFCAGQGGDQGTRALVNNLYGGTFTTADHTSYTWDDPKNIRALEALRNAEGISYDPAIVGGDEIKLFYQEIFKMAFCWNIGAQLDPNAAGTGAGLTMNGQEILPVNFPTESGEPALQGGIWGFGIFDNGDAAKIDAAKQFIKYMSDSENTVEAVKASNFFPARTAAEGTDLTGIWNGNDEMDEYQKFIMPYLGDYYQVTKGWAAARTEWWNMLQEVGRGDDIATAVANHAAAANTAAAG